MIRRIITAVSIFILSNNLSLSKSRGFLKLNLFFFLCLTVSEDSKSKDPELKESILKEHFLEFIEILKNKNK